MEYSFRQATGSDQKRIWEILQQGILRRKKEGSLQWQDGYPNPGVVQKDIKQGNGFVLTEEGSIIGYFAMLINDEPAYTTIEGNWLTAGDFVVFHRIALADDQVGKGLSKKIFQCIEDFALSNVIYSIKADTNHDNAAMLHLFKKMDYTYCGEVYFRGSARKAFEKVLSRNEPPKKKLK